MSKIERYQGDVKAFASNAQGLERTVFGGTTQANDLTSQVTAAFLRGWAIVGPSEHPSLEDFNAAMYAMSQFIAYQHQIGVPEWHAEQEYHTGSVCTHSGLPYQSLMDDNIGNEPPSAEWTPILTAKSGGEYFQPKNGNLTALSGLVGSANRLPYFTGANALALTALTAFARELLEQNDAAGVLTKLGLGDVQLALKYGAPMIGELIAWSRPEMPQELWPDMKMEFIPFMGQSFDTTKYPLLAQVHGNGTLSADMRGQVPRGWDNGRGIDPGRGIMSEQGDAIRNITGSFLLQSDIGLVRPTSTVTGAFSRGSTVRSTTMQGGTASADNRDLLFDAGASGVPTAAENRVKTVAWNMIVRAK